MASIHHEAQRVGVFVDAQNIYYSARFLHKSKVNFREVLNDAVRGRTLVRAIAYLIRTDEVDKAEFFKVLGNLGFETKVKDVQVFADGSRKGDWDIGIAMDAIELAPRLDTIVIVSGDGDFVPLVEHLRRALGCRIECLSFGKSTSLKLKEAVDLFVDLDADKKFLIRGAARPRRPAREVKNA